MKTTRYTGVCVLVALCFAASVAFAGHTPSTGSDGAKMSGIPAQDNPVSNLFSEVAALTTCGTDDPSGLNQNTVVAALQSPVNTTQDVTTVGYVQDTSTMTAAAFNVASTTTTGLTDNPNNYRGNETPMSDNPSGDSPGGGAVSPEPASLLILGMGAIGLVPFVQYRRKKNVKA